eukprot:CAMPEP_0118656660 /NCGR_PEP_ID=MMETSP0785-20121206/13602_1 /TAXON_ID=91992 /ORGANISM="Bolidomonas pacifica, Strain CCMP 1866" /LENGTH=405 /DNA_ID=CAMNT_0006549523 /DNA_START=165 /DNA_END=1378 /DNA_ORIENTATION=-
MPQASLGYFEDGKIVMGPSKRHSRDEGGEDEKGMRGKGRRRRKKRLGLDSPVKKTIAKYPKHLVNLKNAVKTGDMKNLLYFAGLHLEDTSHILPVFSTSFGPWRLEKFSDRLFTDFTKFLYCRNEEERLPLYYAAWAGHGKVLKFIMSCFVVYSAKQGIGKFGRRLFKGGDRGRMFIYQKRTFKEWCEYIGFWKGKFGRGDFQVTYISALNEKMRDILYRQRFSINDCVQILKADIPMCRADEKISNAHDGWPKLYDSMLGGETICKQSVSVKEFLRVRFVKNVCLVYGDALIQNLVKVEQERRLGMNRKAKKPALVWDDHDYGYYDDEGEGGEENNDFGLEEEMEGLSVGSMGKVILKRALSKEPDEEMEEWEEVDAEEEGMEWEIVENESERESKKPSWRAVA